MSMLNLYINLAGKTLPGKRRAVLEAEKNVLRDLYGKPQRRRA